MISQMKCTEYSGAKASRYELRHVTDILELTYLDSGGASGGEAEYADMIRRYGKKTIRFCS